MTPLDRRQNIRNVIALIVAQAVAAAAGFVAFTRIGSLFNVVELGRYSFAVSSTMLFGLLAELGIRYVAIKEIAVDRTASVRVLRHAVAVRALLSIATLALLIVVSEAYLPWRNETRLLFLAGLVAVTQFGAEPLSWVLFGHGRVDIGAAVLVADRVLYVVAINAAAAVWHSAEALLLASFAANVVRSAIAWLWVRPLLKASSKQPKWDPAFFRYLILDGMAIGAAVLVSVAYSQVSVVVAQSVTTPTQLGLYAVAIGLVNILLIVPMALTNALFPALAALVRADETRLLFRTMVRLTLATVIPLAVVSYAFGERLLASWFGAQYLPAAPALHILSIGMIATGFNYLGRILLLTQNRPWLEMWIDLGAAAVVIAGAWPAGARYGSLGIATVYTVVEVVVLVVKSCFLFRAIGGVPQWRQLRSGLVAATLALAALLVPGVWFKALLLIGSSIMLIGLPELGRLRRRAAGTEILHAESADEAELSGAGASNSLRGQR